jgi:ADP-heptose:LPS heptosyltransferase
MYNDLLKKFTNLTIECDERLIPLFKNSFYTHKDKFVKLGTHSLDVNKINNFDYIIYAGSLGKYFRNDLNSFSQKPYLKNIENYIDLELDNILEKARGLKIGISWKSFKNRYSSEKSLSLDDFDNIFKIKETMIFNLQYGDIKEELKNFIKKQNYKIITLKNLDLFNNFTGLANLLKNLDLFVTVSNSTAHLASALGIRTILIKPANHASFHYWNYEDGKTPWYKSVNIISKENLKDKNFMSKFFKL